MFVDFVNLFSDPEGFFKVAPLWVSFAVPGLSVALGAVLATLMFGWGNRGKELHPHDKMLFVGGWVFSWIAALVFWGLLACTSFAAHGVLEGSAMGVALSIWALVMLVAALLAGVTTFRKLKITFAKNEWE